MNPIFIWNKIHFSEKRLKQYWKIKNLPQMSQSFPVHPQLQAHVLSTSDQTVFPWQSDGLRRFSTISSFFYQFNSDRIYPKKNRKE